MDHENAIVISHLTKSYKIYKNPWMRILHAFSSRVKAEDFYAIKDLSVTIPRGEAVGIIGKNGHGKSTLLKMITGVTHPTSGTIETHGRIVAMLELTSGFDKELTGLENIYFRARMIGMEKTEIEARLQDILDFADIGDHVYQPVRTYSSGMKSRLGFAVSVNLDPDILIVDEVLAVGDEQFKIKCLAKMESFRKQGKTILFVSHNLSTVKAFCTSCIWLNQGVMMDYDETGIVVKEYQDMLKAERQKQHEENPSLILSKDDVIHGSKPRLCDKEGTARTSYACGEDIVIRAQYEIKLPMEHLTASVTLFDAEGREVFGSDRQAENLEVDGSVGRHRLSFTMKKPRLLPGSYTVNLELWNARSGFVRRVMTKQPFEMTSEQFLGTGTVSIDCRVRSARIETSSEKQT